MLVVRTDVIITAFNKLMKIFGKHCRKSQPWVTEKILDMCDERKMKTARCAKFLCWTTVTTKKKKSNVKKTTCFRGTEIQLKVKTSFLFYIFKRMYLEILFQIDSN